MMINIIHSDMFRLRKGAALRNAIIGGITVILITGLLLFFVEHNIWGLGNESVNFGVTTPSNQSGGVPLDGAAFATQVRGDSFLPVFVLVFIVSILGADYTAGTIRNTLSFESNRGKVYLSKCCTGVICSLLFTVICVIFSWILGGILFGFTGFGWSYFAQLGLNILLSIPLFIGLIGLGNLILAFSKKASVTIAVYLIGIVAFATITQGIYAFLPSMQWILYLDPLTACKIISQYPLYPPSHIFAMTAVWLIIGAITTVIGLKKYNSDDIS